MEDYSGLNCCQKCAEIICKNFGRELSENERNMLAGFGDGIGIGGLCGAFIGAIAGVGLVLKGQEIDKIRLDIMMDFMDRFSAINCSKLTDYYDNGCEKVINAAVETAVNKIEEFKV